jgi:pyroglutamyl-peptidase
MPKNPRFLAYLALVGIILLSFPPAMSEEKFNHIHAYFDLKNPFEEEVKGNIKFYLTTPKSTRLAVTKSCGYPEGLEITIEPQGTKTVSCNLDHFGFYADGEHRLIFDLEYIPPGKEQSYIYSGEWSVDSREFHQMRGCMGNIRILKCKDDEIDVAGASKYFGSVRCCNKRGMEHLQEEACWIDPDCGPGYFCYRTNPEFNDMCEKQYPELSMDELAEYFVGKIGSDEALNSEFGENDFEEIIRKGCLPEIYRPKIGRGIGVAWDSACATTFCGGVCGEETCNDNQRCVSKGILGRGCRCEFDETCTKDGDELDIELTILLTGYGSFGLAEIEENPSWGAINILDGEIINGWLIKSRQLPVEWSGSYENFKTEIEYIRPHYIFSSGVAPGSDIVTLERRAQNYMWGPDNNGVLKEGEIESGANQWLYSNFDVYLLRDALLENGFNAQVLERELNTNMYLCNYIYYKSLYNYPLRTVVFVHVPEPQLENKNYRTVNDITAAWRVILDNFTISKFK